VLRSAGVRSDRFGDLARFFGLSHWQLHEMVCGCHFGEIVAAEAVEHACATCPGVTLNSQHLHTDMGLLLRFWLPLSC
jgi:hypothetical protein